MRGIPVLNPIVYCGSLNDMDIFVVLGGFPPLLSGPHTVISFSLYSGSCCLHVQSQFTLDVEGPVKFNSHQDTRWRTCDRLVQQEGAQVNRRRQHRSTGDSTDQQEAIQNNRSILHRITGGSTEQ